MSYKEFVRSMKDEYPQVCLFGAPLIEFAEVRMSIP